MRNDAMAMAGMGLLIGVLTLSAAMAGARVPAVSPPGETEGSADAVPVALIELPTAAAGSERRESGPAEETEPAGPFWVALRVGENVPAQLYFTDPAGTPLQRIEPDADGDAALGPVAPGRYAVADGGGILGAFRLLDNAALDGAEGQLWTDGELLHLEAFVPGAVELELELGAPGFYSFHLQGGRGEYPKDLFISEREKPGAGGRWQRSLHFYGLPADSYRLLCGERLLGSLVVEAGSCTRQTVELGGAQ